MRFLTPLLLALPLAALASSIRIRGTPKVTLDLQEAFETSDHVNIMVAMKESTEQIKMVQGDKQGYMEKLMAFTEAQQRPVKDLLAQYPGEYTGTPTFFWITDEVAVPGATAQLVSRLAAIDSVKEIRTEVIAHIDGGIH
ncbi:Aste57867_12853 [Aphanomyces stellatus]|uniref:Aste57867_12853 protein n=1 Tax=Aphanomyces stellatus TaxID=120398 RepID=A0A485KX03_9STRA|nr:hypothetical protein As57867_012805 [Aphanomyces stellatus]VFT89700.1 Aste57867_12853 [Aphanomyces stellatus]